MNPPAPTSAHKKKAHKVVVHHPAKHVVVTHPKTTKHVVVTHPKATKHVVEKKAKAKPIVVVHHPVEKKKK